MRRLQGPSRRSFQRFECSLDLLWQVLNLTIIKAFRRRFKEHPHMHACRFTNKQNTYEPRRMSKAFDALELSFRVCNGDFAWVTFDASHAIRCIANSPRWRPPGRPSQVEAVA